MPVTVAKVFMHGFGVSMPNLSINDLTTQIDRLLTEYKALMGRKMMIFLISRMNQMPL